MEAIMAQKTSKYYTTEFDLEKYFKQSMYQHLQFTGDTRIRMTLGLTVAPLATLKRRLCMASAAHLMQ
jgi:hypothetical protein